MVNKISSNHCISLECCFVLIAVSCTANGFHVCCMLLYLRPTVMEALYFRSARLSVRLLTKFVRDDISLFRIGILLELATNIHHEYS